MKFTHLHTHTHYSLLDGLAKIDDLLAKAKALGMDALAITDHGVMYGIVEFYEKAKAMGIKPIIGIETYIAPRGMRQKEAHLDEDRNHLVLLAKNQIGYLNLIELATKAHLDGFYYKPRLDKECLRAHSEGLIALSACVQGEVAQAILGNNPEKAETLAKEYEAIFGPGNFFLELEDHPEMPSQRTVNDGLLKLSKKLNIPVVVTRDIHYVNPADRVAQDVLLCVQTGRTVDEKGRLSMLDIDCSMNSGEDIYSRFSHIPEALENTNKIAALCNIEIDLNNRYFPAFDFPAGHDADSFLKLEAYRGLARNNNISADSLDEKNFIETIEKQISAPILERLKYELDIISRKGYSAYFLIVADFVNWSKAQGIISTTRGSAAGSFASYCLGITTIDPLKYNLPFERFLNPFRPSPPDIDMDFADNRRDEVIEYVTNKYGKDHVAQIVTFGTMAARGSVRDVARALGFPYIKGDALAKLIPMGIQGFPMTISQAKKITPELEALYNNDPDTKKILDFAEKLEGSPRHASVHAAGIVISPKKLTAYTPLQREARGGKIITQLEMGSIEKVGLVKMDFLGIRNLSILGNAVKIIEKTKNVKIDIERLPLDDQKTFALLAAGKTMGLFQLGGAGMTKHLKELKPTTIFDIMAMVALFRPGPMNSIPEFIQRKHNPALIKYLDPRMKDILNMSYGIITYQDDVLLIAIHLAGYTWEEADKLRKAMGKKIVEEMARQKTKFIDGAIAKGMAKEKARELFKLIEPFAAYGFNKAHAASYAHVAYQTAYLKANYPAEYMAALMTAESGDNETIAGAVVECKKLGIEVLPPDINESLKTFTYINDKTIRFGLLAIKNVGEKFVENLVRERKAKGKFKNIEDFVERVPAEDLNKKSMESLAKAGALDRFGERKMLLENLEQIMTHAREAQKAKNSGQASLFGEMAAISLPALQMKKTAPAAQKEKLAWEKELMGLYISAHPLTEYQNYFAGFGFTPIKNITAEYANRELKIAGIVIKNRQITTKTGKPMAFAEIEDLDGKIEIVIFPKALEKNSAIWQIDKIIKVSGKVQMRDGAFAIIANDAQEISGADVDNADSAANNNPAPDNNPKIQTRKSEPEKENPALKKEINLRLTNVKDKSEEIALLKKIKDLLQTIPRGSCLIAVTVKSNGAEKKVVTPFRINPTPAILNILKGLLGENNVEVK